MAAAPKDGRHAEPLAAPAREFRFTEDDFDRVRKLIHQHAGISLAPIKRDMVYSRLTRRLRALGMSSFAQYLAHLEKGDAREWEAFVNALTTNLTAFFRESHHFPILAAYLAQLRHQPIRIWCSAASTGEEAWSLAITACEAFGTLAPPVAILATDIDTHVLAVGERGLYAEERVEKLSPERVRRFFVKDADVPAGQIKVRPELRKLVTFGRFNLLDARWPANGPFDAVFCRNVMIYFDKETQRRILEKFMPLLREDGLFFAGHSENFLHAPDVVRSLGRTVYERADRKGPSRDMRNRP